MNHRRSRLNASFLVLTNRWFLKGRQLSEQLKIFVYLAVR